MSMIILDLLSFGGIFWRIRVIFFSVQDIFVKRRCRWYIYVYICLIAQGYREATLWHGSKCIEWFLLPT